MQTIASFRIPNWRLAKAFDIPLPRGSQFLAADTITAVSSLVSYGGIYGVWMHFCVYRCGGPGEAPEQTVLRRFQCCASGEIVPAEGVFLGRVESGFLFDLGEVAAQSTT